MSARLRVDMLEDRTTPSLFGTPWPSPDQLTISFAPDGTTIGQHSSTLFASLSSQMSQTVWQSEILRAFQTWAAQTSIQLTVVPDSGAPFGTAGAIQGDARFGDIRIGAAPLSPGVVATAVPYAPEVGTHSGDVIFNTNYLFNVGGTGTAYDLFTISLHEAGHVFGLDGEDNLSGRAMYQQYTGPISSPAAEEFAALQALYGLPARNSFEGTTSNHTLSTATPFREAALATFTEDLQANRPADPQPLSVRGLLTPLDGVDVFVYTTSEEDSGFTVRLRTASFSLLSATLTVLDDAGQIVAQTTPTNSQDPTDRTLRIEAGSLQTFYFRVEGASADVFAVGSYSLVVEPDDADTVAEVHLLRQALQLNWADNNTLQTAHVLTLHTDRLQRASVRSGLLNSTDVDYYQVTIPAGMDGLAVLLVGQGTLTVQLLDHQGTTLATKTGTGEVRLSIDEVDETEVYYIRVSGTDAVLYQFGVFNTLPDTSIEVSSTTTALHGQDDSVQMRDLIVDRYSLVEFKGQLTTPGADLPAGAAVLIAIFDSNNNTVFNQYFPAGEGFSIELWLGAGEYTVVVVAGTTGITLPGSFSYALSVGVRNDPIGPQPINPWGASTTPIVSNPIVSWRIPINGKPLLINQLGHVELDDLTPPWVFPDRFKWKRPGGGYNPLP